MISAVLSSTKPVDAAASPVHAFSSEITTGMSAPPIGSTKRTPRIAAPIRSSVSQIPFSVAAVRITSAARAAPRSALKTFCPRNTSGRPGTSSCSFPNATSEPQKLTEPITAEKRIPTRTSPSRPPSAGARRWNSAAAISAAAPPPTPLKSATICGIAVIRTARADAIPITVPTAIPASINP